MADIELATNSEPRCACVILADRSGSMYGAPISELNAGLQEFKSQLVTDALACLRVEVALVSFNSTVTVEADFASPDHFDPPPLVANGETMLGAALLQALDMLDARTKSYRAAGLEAYRPWLVLISDAQATDDISIACQRIRQAELTKRLCFFGIGVQTVDMQQLARLSLRPPKKLDELRFAELFEWLSVNLSSVAVSQPGDQVPLTAADWATA
jgi:uncharacterized protein YegL